MLIACFSDTHISKKLLTCKKKYFSAGNAFGLEPFETHCVRKKGDKFTVFIAFKKNSAFWLMQQEVQCSHRYIKYELCVHLLKFCPYSEVLRACLKYS